MKEYLTEAEMAKMLKMSRTTLWELRTYYKMPHIKIKKMVRYDPIEVEKWLEKIEVQTLVNNRMGEWKND